MFEASVSSAPQDRILFLSVDNLVGRFRRFWDYSLSLTMSEFQVIPEWVEQIMGIANGSLNTEVVLQSVQDITLTDVP